MFIFVFGLQHVVVFYLIFGNVCDLMTSRLIVSPMEHCILTGCTSTAQIPVLLDPSVMSRVRCELVVSCQEWVTGFRK